MVVPKDVHQNTPVKVGATAGLRQLGVDASERILQAVKDFLKVKSSLKSNDDWVTVLDGTQEGAYQWVTINYLLKRLGKKYSDTVGVVDLGGGSVQMAYAISEADAAKAPSPRLLNGEDTYVKEMLLMGTKYFFWKKSGKSFIQEPWASKVNWHKGDLLSGDTWKEALGAVTSDLLCWWLMELQTSMPLEVLLKKVKVEWFNKLGAGVVVHVADSIKQQEKQHQSSSFIISLEHYTYIYIYIDIHTYIIDVCKNPHT